MNTTPPKPPKRSKFLLIFGAIWFIIGLPFFLFGVHLINTERRFQAEGVVVSGTVLDKTMEEHRDKDNKVSKTYYVNYKFNTQDGKAIESKGSVDSSIWQNLTSGSDIQIQYLPSDDTQNRVASESGMMAGILVSAMGLICVVLGMGFLFYDIKKRMLLSRLMREGELGEATITAIGPGNLTINNVQQWLIHYSFKDRVGRACKGKSEHMSPDEASNWKEGDKGKVRFDKNNAQLNVWLGNYAS